MSVIVEMRLPPDQLEELADMIAVKMGDSRGKKDTYSASEVAARLGVSKDTILRRVKAGTYKKVPGTGTCRISHAELTRILS